MRRVGRARNRRAVVGPRLPDPLVLLDGSGHERLVLDPDALDQRRLGDLVGGQIHARIRHAAGAVLWPEFDSSYDSLAVGVWIQGYRVGWLAHADSARWHGALRRLADVGHAIELGALLESGGEDQFGTPRLGGWLAFDPVAVEEYERAAAAGAFALSLHD